MAKRKWTEEEIEAYRKEHMPLLYFNKEDANFLVPKPYGFGKTVNWANPYTWVCVLVILGIIFVPKIIAAAFDAVYLF